MSSGLYVIKLSDSLVKVGRSSDVESRTKTHLRNARSLGLVPEAPVFIPCATDSLVLAEREAHDRVQGLGGTTTGSREVFKGVDVVDVVQVAREAVDSVSDPGATCDHCWDWVMTLQGPDDDLCVWSTVGTYRAWVVEGGDDRYWRGGDRFDDLESPRIVEVCLSCGTFRVGCLGSGFEIDGSDWLDSLARSVFVERTEEWELTAAS